MTQNTESPETPGGFSPAPPLHRIKDLAGQVTVKAGPILKQAIDS